MIERLTAEMPMADWVKPSDPPKELKVNREWVRMRDLAPRVTDPETHYAVNVAEISRQRQAALRELRAFEQSSTPKPRRSWRDRYVAWWCSHASPFARGECNP